MVEKMNEDLLHIVYKIKKHPNAVLDKKSLLSLSNFINGFVYGYNYPSAYTPFPGFQAYISKRYSCRTVMSWVNILISQTSDDEKAFDLFFAELERFLKENNIAVPEVN